MIRTYLVPLLAIAGVVLAVVTVVKGSRPPVPVPPLVEPPRAPFDSFVAGSGLLEASSQNIAIGTPVAGVAEHIAVRVGQDVKAGEELFRIDARELRAELVAREAGLKVAEAQLTKLRLGTRPEEMPQMRARVAEAQSLLDDAAAQLAMWQNVSDKRAVSEDELTRRRFGVASAQARLDEARAELALKEAGSWSADLAVGEAQVESARAQVEQARTHVERHTVRAPVDGRVLQINLRRGEFAPAGPLASPLMVVGTVDPLHVRVDVDENDAWRVKSGTEARAFVRGNKDIWSDLSFVRFEPYVIPKRSLTGESTERVDTRVLQVIYAMKSKDLPIFVGQQMDVYIKAEPIVRSEPPKPRQGAN